MVIKILGLTMVALFGLSFLFPEHTWGFHQFSFLPNLWAIGLLLCATTIVLFPSQVQFSSRPVLTNWTILIVGLLVGVLSTLLPIANDIYGDAVQYASQLDITQSEFPASAASRTFNFGLDPEASRQFQLLLVAIVSWAFEIPYRGAFLVLDSVFGVLFTWTWLLAVRRFVSSSAWRLAWSLAGIVSPTMLVFFGHMETYAITYWVLLLWLTGLVVQLNSRNRTLLFVLFVGLLVCVRLHPLLILLGVGWVMAAIKTFSARLSTFLLNPKGILLFVMLPIFISGLVLYFFVFEDHTDERLLRNIEPFDRLFLPIFSPEPPLDRYNMFSWNHILDFLNVVFSWSPIGVFLVLGMLISRGRPKEFLSSPAVLVLGTLLLLFSAFLFAINPLLSMPMDWDLFSIPAIIFLVFGLVCTASFEQTAKPLHGFIKGSIAISLLVIPVFIVNASTTMLSERLEVVGIRIFKTYYERGRETILLAQSMVDVPSQEMILRKKKVVEELKKHAVVGVDPAFATLATDLGIYQYSTSGDLNQALENLELGLPYFPGHRDNHLYQVQILFELGRPREAYQKALKLVERSHPSKSQAFRIAIQMALEASYFTEAKYLCNQYLEYYPKDTLINEIRVRIDDKDRMGELKQLFSRTSGS